MLRQIKKPINVILLLIVFFEFLYLGVSIAYAEDTDKNLTDLTILGSADCSDDELIYVVDDPNGTPLARAIARYEFLLGWAGSANITTLGTIATGTWEGDVVDHERGGLEADINAYSGLVAVSGGATSEIDAKSELEGQIADVADFAEADGDIYTGAHDFGGATSIELVNGTDPDVDAMGEVSIDSDGANEPNDVIMRVTDTGGDTQYALSMVLKSFQATVVSPQDLDDTTRDACPIWENSTGMTFTITKIRAWSDTDDTTVNVETYDSDWNNNATVDGLEIATDGTANYYVEETTITAATIADGSWIVLDFDDSDDPGWVHVNVMGYFNADVD